MFSRSSMFILVVAAFVLIVRAAPVDEIPENDIASVCPEIFSYVDRRKSGVWTGNLYVTSPEELNGCWIRMLFDNEVAEVTVKVRNIINSLR